MENVGLTNVSGLVSKYYNKYFKYYQRNFCCSLDHWCCSPSLFYDSVVSGCAPCLITTLYRISQIWYWEHDTSLSLSHCAFGSQLYHCSPCATLQIKLVKFFHPLRSSARCLKMSRSFLVLNCLICNRWWYFAASTMSLSSNTGRVILFLPRNFFALGGQSK